MQLPSPDPDTLFEDMLQDLPSEAVEMAREFKAFARARKIKTPQQLLRAVLLYCGLDQSLREVAGTMTLLVQRITDSSIAERLITCRPWVKALLPKMLGYRELATLPPTDASSSSMAARCKAPGRRAPTTGCTSAWTW